MAQLVERSISAQVMISQSVGSSPALGSALTAWSLEPASHSVSPSLSVPPLLAFCLSLSKIKIKTKKGFFYFYLNPGQLTYSVIMFSGRLISFKT